MHNVSNEFKQYINEHGRQNRIQISFDDVVLGYDSVHKIDKQFDADFYRSVMQQIEGEVKGRHDLTDKVLHIEYAVGYNGLAWEWVDYGFFIVKEHERIVGSDPEFDKTTFKAYDIMLNAHTNYDTEQLGVAFPIAVYDLFVAIASLMGTSVTNESIINGSQTIEEDKWTNIEDVTYRNVLDEIAATSGSTIVVKNNRLLAKYVDTDLTESELDGLPKIYENNMKSLTISELYGPVNILNLTREQSHDNYPYPSNWEQIPVNERVEIVIPDNQIMDKRREEYAPSLFDSIQGLSYYPFETESSGVAYLEPMDLANVVDMNGNSHLSIITSNRLQISSGVKESISSAIPGYTKEKYALVTDNKRKMLRVYFLVDQQNGIIQGLIEQSNEQGNKLTELELSVDGISSTVDNINNVNIIPNNVGLDGFEKWTFISQPVIANTEVPYATAKNEKPFLAINENDPIVRIVETDTIAESGFEFWKDGIMLSEKVPIQEANRYCLRVLTKGSGKVQFRIREFKDDDLLSIINMSAISQSSVWIRNDSDFTPSENASHIRLEIDSKVSPYGDAEYTAFTDLMLVRDIYKDYAISGKEVYQWSRGELNQYADLIEAKVSQTQYDSETKSSKVQLTVDGFKTYGDGVEHWNAGGSKRIMWIDTVGELVNIDANLKLGRVGGWVVDDKKITSPDGKLTLDSTDNSIKVGSMKMKHSLFVNDTDGNVDVFQFGSNDQGVKVGYTDSFKSFVITDRIFAPSTGLGMPTLAVGDGNQTTIIAGLNVNVQGGFNVLNTSYFAGNATFESYIAAFYSRYVAIEYPGALLLKSSSGKYFSLYVLDDGSPRTLEVTNYPQ